MDGDKALELWGGHECTVSRTGENTTDQTRLSGHQDRIEDLELFASLGITSLRYPVLWERTAPDLPDVRDFSWSDERLSELHRLGINPIIGLIHHGSGPHYTSLLDPGFAAGLADHARAVAERYPWVRDWTPVNEPLTTARFSCLYGFWYPHRRDEAALWLALLNQIDATRLSMRAIRAVNPDARLIQTEDLGGVSGTNEVAGQVRFEKERRWITWDLLAGRVTPHHPLWDRIARHGLADRLAAIAADPCPADVIGINHYLCSNRYLTHRFDRHPGIAPASDGTPCINTDAVRTVERNDGIPELLRAAAARYGSTIAITECHNGSTREEQLRWFAQTWDAAVQARADGIDVVAVTAWSLLGAYDWNSLLTRHEGVYEPGVFDVRGPGPRPTAMVGLLRSLARGETAPMPHIASGKGWWQRRERFYPGYGPGSESQPHPPAGPPILITGASGTLARAFAGACELRGLAYVLTDRAALALDAPESIGAALDEHRPWAVINCAGIVDIDAAETRQQLCHRVNAVGPELLARASRERGARFVQISSDQVFDGGGQPPYVEKDPAHGLNAYGRSKAEAERRIALADPTALIVRTAAFFSPWDGHNFAVHAVDRLAAGEPVHAPDDQVVSPTYVPDLVAAILDLLIDEVSGIRHLASAGGASWAELARMVARACQLDERLVVGVPTSALHQIARRPSDARLGTEFGQIMPTLESAIARFADAYAPLPVAHAEVAE